MYEGLRKQLGGNEDYSRGTLVNAFGMDNVLRLMGEAKTNDCIWVYESPWVQERKHKTPSVQSSEHLDFSRGIINIVEDEEFFARREDGLKLDEPLKWRIDGLYDLVLVDALRSQDTSNWNVSNLKSFSFRRGAPNVVERSHVLHFDPFSAYFCMTNDPKIKLKFKSHNLEVVKAVIPGLSVYDLTQY